MALLLRKIRRMVSQGRERLDDGEYELDLTYVTDRIVAMGLPAEGLTAAYRNPIDDVVGYLSKHHGGNFMLINLAEIPYDSTKFGDQVLSFPFKDHHAPPLSLLYTIACSIRGWLAADPANVACIHCRAGKGRTGTIIAAYLVFSGLMDDPVAALDYYAFRRARRRKGGRVTNPCQRRAVAMFADLVVDGVPLRDVPRRLLRVIFHGTPPALSSDSGFRPYIEVYDVPGGEMLASSRREVSVMEHFLASDDEQAMVIDLVDLGGGGSSALVVSSGEDTDGGAEGGDGGAAPLLDELQGVPICGDVYVRVYHADDARTLSLRRFTDTYLFRAQLHTGFMEPVVRLTKADLDDGLKDDRIPDDFAMELISITQSEALVADSRGSEAASPGASSGCAAEQEGAVVLQHDVSDRGLLHGAECFRDGPPSRDLVDAVVEAAAGDGTGDAAMAARLEARATKRSYVNRYGASDDDPPVVRGQLHQVSCVAYDAGSRTLFVGTAGGLVYVHSYKGLSSSRGGLGAEPALVQVLDTVNPGEDNDGGSLVARPLDTSITVVHLIAEPTPMVLVGDSQGRLTAWTWGSEPGAFACFAVFEYGSSGGGSGGEPSSEAGEAGEADAGAPSGIASVLSRVMGNGAMRVFVAGQGHTIAEIGGPLTSKVGAAVPDLAPRTLLPAVTLDARERVVGMVWTGSLGLLVGLAAGTVGMVRSGQYLPLITLPSGSPGLSAIAWNDRGHVLYTLAADGSTGMWDTASLARLLQQEPVASASGPFSISPCDGQVPVTGRAVWTLHSGGHVLVARDILDGDLVFSLDVEPTAYTVVSAENGRVLLFVGTGDLVVPLCLHAV